MNPLQHNQNRQTAKRKENRLIPFAVLVVLICYGAFTSAQEIHYTTNRSAYTSQNPPPRSRTTKKILLQHADLLTYDAYEMPGVQRLSGSVVLEHEGWTMSCDSAHLNEQSNSFNAFGRIHITEGDSITLDGSYLEYDGNSRMAFIEHNVLLTNRTTTLNTEQLFYDRNIGLAYYLDGGVITDERNVLSSMYGEYEPSTGNSVFEQDVELTNEDFVLTTEQLLYNTESKVCNIVTDTYIVSDSTTIETNRGTYNTDQDVGILLDRSVITDPDGILIGDSIYYDNLKSIGHAYGDVYMDNQKDQILFRSDYGYIDRENQYTFASWRAYATDYSKKDSLYIAADTLEGITYTPEQSDKEIKYIRAYKNARLFRQDLQGAGDSINYFSLDSMISLHGNALLWRDSVQIQANDIYTYIAGDTLQYSQGIGQAGSMKMLYQPNRFDMVRSDTLTAFFADSTVHRIFYVGNAESVYHLEQESIKRYYAVCRITSPSMDVYLQADTLHKIHWIGPAKGKLYPIEQVTPEQSSLSGIVWKEEVRPHSPLELFPNVSAHTDSMSFPARLTPEEQQKYNGLLAWHLFEPQFKSLLHKDDSSPTPRPNSQHAAPVLSPYIARPKEGVDLESDESQPQDSGIDSFIYFTPWHYFLDQEVPENINTNLSIGIPKKKLLISE